jgi:hypothetical protein
MKHKEKVSQKNKLNMINQEMEEEKAKLPEPHSLPRTSSKNKKLLSPDYRMYEYQMKCEMHK